MTRRVSWRINISNIICLISNWRYFSNKIIQQKHHPSTSPGFPNCWKLSPLPRQKPRKWTTEIFSKKRVLTNWDVSSWCEFLSGCIKPTWASLRSCLATFDIKSGDCLNNLLWKWQADTSRLLEFCFAVQCFLTLWIKAFASPILQVRYGRLSFKPRKLLDFVLPMRINDYDSWKQPQCNILNMFQS